MVGIRGGRSRSRSPVRRSGGPMGDRRGRDRNNHFNKQSDKMIYLSNLPYEMTWMELKDILREKAGEVNFVETLDGRNGKSKGCAVVEFRTKDSAVKCVDAMHRVELRGRLVVAKEIRDPIAFFRKVKEDTGVDFLGSRDRRDDGPRDRNVASRRNFSNEETFGLSPAFLEQLNIKGPLVNRIFVTNISYSCGVGRLYDVCSMAGKVTWLDLQLDKDGKSKGMAICEYSHPIEAVQAISMLNNQRLYDRVLTVKMDSYEKEPGRRDGELPVGLRSIGMGLGANGAPLADVASVINSMQQTPQTLVAQQPFIGAAFGNTSATNNTSAMNPFAALGANSAMVNNPFGVNLQSAQQSVLQPQQQSYATGNTDRSAGFGAHNQGAFSQTPNTYFNSSSSNQGPAPLLGTPNSSYYNKNSSGSMAQPKMEFNNPSSYGNGPSALGSGTSSGGGISHQQQGSLTAGYGANSSGGASGVAYNSMAQPAKYESSYETPSRVFLIKNLPMDYTNYIVSDRVAQFGELENVEMLSPGVAKVRYVTIPDAERARNALQGTTVEGRVIAIEYL